MIGSALFTLVANGGALAVKYALDALENPQLARPDRLILLSPMIGITRFARLAGVAGHASALRTGDDHAVLEFS